MPDLIVETDLGHDPDDLFALCYLAAAGTRLRAITIVPGDPDQLAVARLFARVIGADIPVGASHLTGRRPSSGGVHHRLLDHFGLPRAADPDGPGDAVLAAVLARHPAAQVLVTALKNETLLKLLCPNVVVVHQPVAELGIEPVFWSADKVGPVALAL